MVNHGTLRIAFATVDEARAADAALAPDDAGHVRHRVEGGHLVVEADGESFLGLLRSLDDVMTCLRVLEGADPDLAADRQGGN